MVVVSRDAETMYYFGSPSAAGAAVADRDSASLLISFKIQAKASGLTPDSRRETQIPSVCLSSPAPTRTES